MDWNVWPIFLAQALIFLLFFLKPKQRVLLFTLEFWIIFLMFLVDVAIVVSLIHDSTDKLNLFF